jgi:hypothetical protein
MRTARQRRHRLQQCFRTRELARLDRGAPIRHSTRTSASIHAREAGSRYADPPWVPLRRQTTKQRARGQWDRTGRQAPNRRKQSRSPEEPKLRMQFSRMCALLPNEPTVQVPVSHKGRGASVPQRSARSEDWSVGRPAGAACRVAKPAIYFSTARFVSDSRRLSTLRRFTPRSE